MQDWNQSPLAIYLKLDKWPRVSAMLVLAGFRFPDHEPVDGIYIPGLQEKINHPVIEQALHHESFTQMSEQERMIVLAEMHQKLHSLLGYLEYSNWNQDNNTDTPANFIRWAVSKGIIPDWLEWAIGQGLCSPEVNPLNQISRSYGMSPAHPCYAEELDWALQAWHTVANTQGKGKPKARILKWLDEHAPHLSNDAKERIATVANWDKKGGATRSDQK